MSQFKRTLYALALVFLGTTGKAYASCSTSVPYVFTPTSQVSYVTQNANNSYLNACSKTVDNTQIGTAGIFASQIKPTNGTQATFGGSQTYTFPVNLSVTGGTTTNGFVNNGAGTITGQAIVGSVNSSGDIVWGGVSTGGTLAAASGNINHTGNLTTGGNASIAGNESVTGTQTVTGATNLNGGLSTTTIGAGTSITNNGPLNNGGTINANNTGTSLAAAGSVTIAGNTTMTGSLTANNGLVTTALTNSGALNNTGTINANASGTSLTTAGSVSVGGGTTTNGFVNNAPSTLNGNVTVTGNTATSGNITAGGNANITGSATVGSLLSSGNINASGLVTSASLTGGAATLTPTFTSDGTSPGTYHSVLLKGATGVAGCGPSGGTNCATIVLSSALAFTSVNTYACGPVNYSNGTVTFVASNWPQSTDGKTFYLQGTNSASQNITALCTGF